MLCFAGYDSVNIITWAGGKGKGGTRMERWRGEMEDEVIQADVKLDKVLKAY